MGFVQFATIPPQIKAMFTELSDFAGVSNARGDTQDDSCHQTG